ncbi:SMP-30/gluconolactonase/LRE family protein [Flammeovirgaceae bacterium SG7u.111]|nr:SMP-30/gluconolactonase/LRE family protein [Flammeovirgaceae bacterium SG7u.132]WPO36260.1 SMP-30/gluconolactonase/LRE family protein [Flammeovirgaceae bacterium SG7u.111]
MKTTEILNSYEVKHRFAIRSEHGEGPVWDEKAKKFYWVDLLRGKYYKADANTGVVKGYEMGQPLGVMALCNEGSVVAALKDGFAYYNEKADILEIMENPEKSLPETRFNDGAVDPKGRFLAGTMKHDGSKPIGSLYSFETGKKAKKLEEDIYITSGMDWSVDGKTFFLTDTNRHVIWAYDYDLETGNISNRRDHIVFGKDEYPDGMCIDSEGGFWVAMWEGSKLSHFDADGNKIEDIPLPVKYPTSCCFGGDDMKELFITTSLLELDDEEREETRTAGKVLSIRTNVKGKKQYRFRK